MALGLLEAFLASCCYGLATPMQAVGLRRGRRSQGVDPRVLVRALRSLPYLAGVSLDVLGLVASLAALHQLPLFVSQAVVNTSLAITALACVPLLRVRLATRDVIAVVTVTAGLILIGMSAGHEAPAHVSAAFQWGLLVVAIALSGVALLLAKSRLATPVVIGGASGTLFGLFSLCVRVLPNLSPLVLLRSPALYALMVAGVCAYGLIMTALQHGSVTAATAAMVVGETALPALLGVVVLGDHPRPGFGVVAVLGFLAAVGGALALARYGEVPDTTGPTAA
jgi:drug/metabolite transporter (DMT)-like permease